MAEWNIQRLRKPQLKTATQAMSEAFAEDPLARYLQPDESKLRPFNDWFFERSLNYGLMWGDVWADSEAQGAAAWLRPGETDMTFWRTFRAGFMTLPFKAGLSGMSRFNHLDKVLERMRKASIKGRYWYLMLLGVSPSAQGSGLGSALVKTGTDRADDDGVPCYLETETKQNVEFYQRRGFEVSAEAEIAPGFTMWSMRREPA